jgi:ornithine cyclodeaminase/alanine dehydrogenase-like protein (mu-crystallin family)
MLYKFMKMNKKGLLYLSYKDVEHAGLSMEEMVNSIEETLREKYFRRVEMPPKPGIHTRKEAFIHAMPAYVPKKEAAGMKWISGYLDNIAKGLPYITGLIVLNDPETGIPICVMDATWITAKRTGVITAISAKYLARRDSKAIGIVGCGVQGRSNLEALSFVLNNIREVRAFDVIDSKLENYLHYVKSTYKYNVIGTSKSKEAIEDSDVIVTATPIMKGQNPIARYNWVKAGSLICPIEFGSYWDTDTFFKVDKLCTDDIEQLIYYKEKGYFQKIGQVYSELSELVAGVKKGRESSDERITAVNLGLALVDVAVAKAVYEKALKKGIGIALDL